MKVFKAETEFSKVWIEKNPELFANSVLEFLEQHPYGYWQLAMSQTNGFVTISATLESVPA